MLRPEQLLDQRTAERDEALEAGDREREALRAAGRSLRATEERHNLIIQAVAEGIYDWNIETDALWVSPA